MADAHSQLLHHGFEFLTTWEMRNGTPKPTDTKWDTNAGWLYAYVAQERIRYIGITTNVLRMRLDNYSYQLNDKVGTNIKLLLENGTLVSIFGARRPGVSQRELRLEESSLIESLQPEWNVRR